MGNLQSYSKYEIDRVYRRNELLESIYGAALIVDSAFAENVDTDNALAHLKDKLLEFERDSYE